MPIKNLVIDSPEEKVIRAELENRQDTDGLRLRRFLAMPDLSRTPGSPLHDLVERILAIPDFQHFNVIRVPEITPIDISFDLFNFPPDHPARKSSDTYFVTFDQILRTHTSVMWYYYLTQPEIKERVVRGEALGVLSFGKVYRKDEIDRQHMNVFHQMDGLYICRKEAQALGTDDLKNILIKIARAIYGPGIEYRFNQDTFPYTDPSLEMEINLGGDWVEVLGSGMVQPIVLDKLGVDSKIYHGWAFGFGLERLAILSMTLPDIRLLWSNDERVKKQLKLGNPYREVSKYPPITRDISFIVGKDFVPNNYFDLIRDIGGNLVEEVKLLDNYQDLEKFGPDRISYTYRIIYRSNERTLEAREIDPLQQKIYSETARQFQAELR